MLTKHETLCKTLKREIAEGKYGRALPSEASLVQRFGLSRITVQRALRDLEREGLVRKIPRKGAFIVSEQERSRTIEIAFPSAMGAADAEEVLRAAEQAAARRGYSVLRVTKGK